MSATLLPDHTNDPKAISWLATANIAGSDFPIQNLPFAVFRAEATDTYRGGVAIGDHIIDLARAAATGIYRGDAAIGIAAGADTTLNGLMRLGAPILTAVRSALFDSLLQGSPHEAALRRCLIPQHSAQYALPARIGDYTDFYTSIYHATAVGRMMRPDNPLLPNYSWVPIGYHGRSSSIGISGEHVRRPRGQRLPPGASVPVVGPSARLDYELELGAFIGAGNSLGNPIPMADAESHLFGLCLLNDWSARDLQAWEYQPLGPFLAKNFATTISPWIVTLQALAPFRAPFSRPDDHSQPLPYLTSPSLRETGAFDITLEAQIQTEAMRRRHEPPYRLSCTSFKHAYWTLGQLVTHHTVNGCDLRPGDLLGTGTQSGPTSAEAGSLLELSAGGKQPVQIPGGETRAFLEDGDTVILKGWCSKPGVVRIGFGEVSATVLPASA